MHKRKGRKREKKMRRCRNEKVEKKNNRNKGKGYGEGRSMENWASNWAIISKSQVTNPSYRISLEGYCPLSSNM